MKRFIHLGFCCLVSVTLLQAIPQPSVRSDALDPSIEININEKDGRMERILASVREVVEGFLRIIKNPREKSNILHNVARILSGSLNIAANATHKDLKLCEQEFKELRIVMHRALCTKSPIFRQYLRENARIVHDYLRSIPIAELDVSLRSDDHISPEEAFVTETTDNDIEQLAQNEQELHSGILSSLYELVQDLFAIIQNPENPQIIGQSIADMLASIMNVASQVLKYEYLTSKNAEENVALYLESFSNELTKEIKHLMLQTALHLRGGKCGCPKACCGPCGKNGCSKICGTCCISSSSAVCVPCCSPCGKCCRNLSCDEPAAESAVTKQPTKEPVQYGMKKMRRKCKKCEACKCVPKCNAKCHKCKQKCCSKTKSLDGEVTRKKCDKCCVCKCDKKCNKKCNGCNQKCCSKKNKCEKCCVCKCDKKCNKTCHSCKKQCCSKSRPIDDEVTRKKCDKCCVCKCDKKCNKKCNGCNQKCCSKKNKCEKCCVCKCDKKCNKTCHSCKKKCCTKVRPIDDDQLRKTCSNCGQSGKCCHSCGHCGQCGCHCKVKAADNEVTHKGKCCSCNNFGKCCGKCFQCPKCCGCKHKVKPADDEATRKGKCGSCNNFGKCCGKCFQCPKCCGCKHKVKPADDEATRKGNCGSCNNFGKCCGKCFQCPKCCGCKHKGKPAETKKVCPCDPECACDPCECGNKRTAETKVCPCNKPKPKPKAEETKACPCNQGGIFSTQPSKPKHHHPKGQYKHRTPCKLIYPEGYEEAQRLAALKKSVEQPKS